MKRIVSVLLCLLLVLGLSGCGLLSLVPSSQTEETSGLEVVPASSYKATNPAATDRPEESEQTSPAETSPTETDPAEDSPALLDEDGWYNSKEEVALYIHQYGKLPGNYITKKEAEALGWTGGSLEPYAPGKSIGGSYFGNYEDLLPKAKGRSYTECDIDTAGKKSRGAKRIVFSNDGYIYYTEDHYETFELLYSPED